MIKIIRMYSPDSNMYLIDEKILVDTSTGRKPEFIPKNVEIVVNTHLHCDHIGGNKYVDGEICMHFEDAKLLMSKPEATYCHIFGIVPVRRVDRVLKEGDVLETEERKLIVIHTPGHTPGSICLYDPENKILFSGDTVFKNAVGRTDLIGSSSEEMIKSLKKLAKLEIDVIYPGHGHAVTKDANEMLYALIENF